MDRWSERIEALVTPQTRAELERRAREQHRSVSSLAREALVSFLEPDDREPVRST